MISHVKTYWLTSCDRKQSVSRTGTKSLPHIHSPQTSPCHHTGGLFFLPYCPIASWLRRTSSELCSEASLFVSCLPLCSRTPGSRWSTAGHAAAGGLGGFGLCPSSGSLRPWAARSHAGPDGAKRCTHEAQQPTRAPADAPVPDDCQRWEDDLVHNFF